MKNILTLFLLHLICTVGYGQNNQNIMDRPNTVIIISMPANEEEFFNIFKRSPKAHELESITPLLSQYKDLKNVYILKHPDDLDKIKKTILGKAEKGLYDEYYPRIGFSIVGHNDKGNFYFPDGTYMKLEDVERKLGGAPAMFLSCNAKDYGVTGVDYKLTYPEALSIATKLDNIVTEIHDKRMCNIYFDTPRKIATTMIEDLNTRNKIKYTAKFLGAAGGMTGGFVLLRRLDNSNDTPKVGGNTR
jgi:hypothetical protein